jgi:hypothetical protein
MKNSLKIIVNIAIFVLIAGFVGYLIYSKNINEIFFAKIKIEEPIETPYRQVSSFSVPGEINRIDLYDNKIYLSIGQSVYIYDTEGTQLASFLVDADVRDIVVDSLGIYVLYSTYIEVYSEIGELIREWEACSELSDYASLALVKNFVFVTDATNKDVCQYTNEGNFVRFIKSPQGFIIPSHTFDIEAWNDTIYVANSGRHLIESYTLDGKFIAAFGSSGADAGSFVGCCNPTYISFTSEGNLLTSEKGNPRISLFERDGTFKKLILNSPLLGGGTNAYEMRAKGNKLFVAGRNAIMIFIKE